MEVRLSHGGGENLGPWRKGKVVLAGQRWTWKGRWKWPKVSLSCAFTLFHTEGIPRIDPLQAGVCRACVRTR